MSGVSNYPNADSEDLRRQYVGRFLHEIEGPAAVIDVAVARRNCELMLNTAASLGVDFRSHVKSHKVVYGLPVSPSCVPRLAALGNVLGEGSITVLVDSLDILPYTSRYHDLVGHSLGIFVKVDTGYHRAGVLPESTDFHQMITEIHRLESSEAKVNLRGFYSHLGSSYGSDSSSEALNYLATELEGCTLSSINAGKVYGQDRRFILSVGATPTTVSAHELVFAAENDSPAVLRVRKALSHAKEHHTLELHAGAYVTLDMQQLAAHSRTSNLSFNNVAVSVLTEVASVYNHREPTPEALVPCGKLSLGYDTCRNYEGMGVVMPWLDRTYPLTSIVI
ncbi:hypothetical protein KEM54_002350 [Ascosphaera aggregata]|nr:hypothetical protein KEM54_002350 [Ascosphaera aggregata]